MSYPDPFDQSLPYEVTNLINDKIVLYLRAIEVVNVETQGTFAGTIAIIIAENNEAVKKRRRKNEAVTE
ncbi:hypothetical protein [uncultured Draconibacterium sp.]|uniref:hypothetical protein n=1 Tax=uncultured Draconibacterium sp. TaxID=1573823 RepID=UPI0029C8469C|nr:hypothetical protein [uncultured Draconibacterium sp.]